MIKGEEPPICVNSIFSAYSKKNYGTPSKINLYTYSTQGSVSAWNISSLDSPEKVRQNLNSICWGHESDISQTIVHPKQPFTVTIDNLGNAIFWYDAF
jgi:hypothetical protein